MLDSGYGRISELVTDLEVWTGHALCELVEERLLDLGKLGRIHDLKDIFHFVEEHNLLRAVGLRPVTEEP